jgi:hypothetical protein
LIIANAKRQSAVLVTNEAKQADLGKTKSKNYKIPAVCKPTAHNQYRPFPSLEIYLKIFHQSAV